MAGRKQARGQGHDQPRGGASKRERRKGERRSLNLSVCVEHHVRFKGLALLLGREPGELMMDWIEEKTAGMRFFMPGAKEGQGGEDAPPAPGEAGDDAPDTLPCRRQAG